MYDMNIRENSEEKTSYIYGPNVNREKRCKRRQQKLKEKKIGK